MLLFPASATMPLRLYLDESGTLGFGGEVFTMAMVLVSDLAKLETSIARNKTTQAEIKASQMKTPRSSSLPRSSWRRTTCRSSCSPSTRRPPTPASASSTRSCSTTP